MMQQLAASAKRPGGRLEALTGRIDRHRQFRQIGKRLWEADGRLRAGLAGNP